MTAQSAARRPSMRDEYREELTDHRQRLERIETTVGEIQGDVADIRETLDDHGRRLDRIEARLDNHGHVLADHGRRLDGIETRLTNVETRLDGIETRLTNVETMLVDLTASVSGLADLVRDSLNDGRS